ncbi:hypothetical protein O5W32_001376 [Enterococcus faecium]|nr:hypothetical protein [Enterococcus faecium]EHK9936747.1 hypothetical protein [Enterococcus faecium]EME3580364.1 hypothetical protein [Enterococcus faecium]EME7158836.1 hypothetical protein [Enterococcus faecium]
MTEMVNVTMTYEKLLQLIDERAEVKAFEILAQKQESKNFKNKFCKLVDQWLNENGLTWKVKDPIYAIVKAELGISAISYLDADNYDKAVQTFEEVKHYFVKE